MNDLEREVITCVANDIELQISTEIDPESLEKTIRLRLVMGEVSGSVYVDAFTSTDFWAEKVEDLRKHLLKPIRY